MPTPEMLARVMLEEELQEEGWPREHDVELTWIVVTQGRCIKPVTALGKSQVVGPEVIHL